MIISKSSRRRINLIIQWQLFDNNINSWTWSTYFLSKDEHLTNIMTIVIIKLMVYSPSHRTTSSSKLRARFWCKYINNPAKEISIKPIVEPIIISCLYKPLLSGSISFNTNIFGLKSIKQIDENALI